MNKLTYFVGCLIIIIGSIITWGWLSHNSKLLDIFTYGVNIKFTTGLWYVFAGVNLLFLDKYPKTAFYLGIILVLWALSAFFFEYVYLLPILTNYFKRVFYDATLLEIPAPNTCICFTLIGLIYILNRYASRFIIVVINLLLSFGIASLGLVAVIGYSLQMSTAYGWYNLTQMSLLSALVVLSFGLTFIYKFSLHIPKDKKILYLPLGSFIFIGLFSGLLWTAVYQFENKVIESVLHDHLKQASENIINLLNSMQSAFIRFKNRMDNSSYIQNEFWKNDSDSYVKSIEGIQSISLLNNNQIKILSYNEKANIESSRNNILNCFSKVNKKTISYIYMPENQTLCFAANIINNKNFNFVLFVYDLNAFLKPIENHEIENWYKIGVTYNDKIIILLRDNIHLAKSDWEVRIPLSFKDIHFSLYGIPSKAFIKELGSNLPYYLLFFSLVFAILWSVIILYLVKESKQEGVITNLNKRLQLILDSSHMSIIATDLNGTITHFNHAAEIILGYSADEMINLKTPATFHDRNEVDKKATELTKKLGKTIQPGFDVFVAELDRVSNTENEWTYITKSGKRIPVLLSVTAMRDQNNTIYGYLGIALDISERKEIDRIKNEFVSMVSHELRTPLTSIHGSLILLIDQIPGSQTTESLELLNIALNNTDRLIRLINDILDLEKIESAKMKFTYGNFHVNDLIKESICANEGYAQKFSVTLEPHLLNEDVEINVDHDRMIQVLTNLISNAIKFSPINSSIIIDAQTKDNQVIFSVIDKGKGIPLEFQKIIFNKFAQADSSPIRKQQGTGLGLNISKLIVDSMNGVISFDSQANKGTAFHVSFKIHDHHESNKKSLIKSDEKPMILHIEDDCDLYKVLNTLLKKDYKLDLAADIDSAKNMLDKNNYQLAILDLKLKEIFAYELIPYLYKLNIPVIVLTSYDLPSEYEKYVKSVLIKSKVSNDTIVKTIHDTIKGT